MSVEEVVDFYWKQAVSEMDENMFNDADVWYSHVVNLPEKLQATYTIGILNQQVLNGGLHQYFLNSYGQFGYLTLEHLSSIKAYKISALLEKALMEVNSEHHDFNEFRYLIFNRRLSKVVNFDDKLFETLNNIDTEYYACVEEMEDRWAEYLRS